MSYLKELFSGNIILSTVALISIGLNIFQFVKKRKIDKIDLKKKIKLKEIEMEELRNRHSEEQRKLESEYESEERHREFSYVDLRTENDKRNADNLFNRQKHEEEKLFAELAHLYELNGEAPVLFPLSRTKKIKFEIKSFFSRIKRKLLKTV